MNKYPITPTLSTDDNTPTAVFKQFCFDIANSSAWDYRFQCISFNPIFSIYDLSNVLDDDGQLLDELQAVLYEFSSESLNRINKYLNNAIPDIEVALELSYSSEYNIHLEDYEEFETDESAELISNLRALEWFTNNLQFTESAGIKSLAKLSCNINELIKVTSNI